MYEGRGLMYSPKATVERSGFLYNSTVSRPEVNELEYFLFWSKKAEIGHLFILFSYKVKHISQAVLKN